MRHVFKFTNITDLVVLIANTFLNLKKMRLVVPEILIIVFGILLEFHTDLEKLAKYTLAQKYAIDNFYEICCQNSYEARKGFVRL